jgi:hypothetical protein
MAVGIQGCSSTPEKSKSCHFTMFIITVQTLGKLFLSESWEARKIWVEATL